MMMSMAAINGFRQALLASRKQRFITDRYLDLLRQPQKSCASFVKLSSVRNHLDVNFILALIFERVDELFSNIHIAKFKVLWQDTYFVINGWNAAVLYADFSVRKFFQFSSKCKGHTKLPDNLLSSRR